MRLRTASRILRELPEHKILENPFRGSSVSCAQTGVLQGCKYNLKMRKIHDGTEVWMYAKGTGLINYGTVSEISSYCWNVTQRWCVVSCRRFGTACLIFKVQSTKFFLDCLFVDCRNLEDGTDRLSRNVCNLTTNKHCVTSKNSADLIYIAAEARRHVVSALFCSVRWHASGPITYIAVLWLNARTSMLIQHTTTQPRIVIVWKWFASDAHTYHFVFGTFVLLIWSSIYSSLLTSINFNP